MSIGWPATIAGIAYCLITLFFGLTIGKKKNYYTWPALFITLAVTAGLSVIYQSFDHFHGPAFWILVATTGTAGAFLFLAANMTLAKPTWTWLHWMWPLMGLVGLLVGGTLAPMPSYYSITVTWICIGLSVLILQKCGNKYIRNWIYLGVTIKIISVLVINLFHNGSGWTNPMAVERLLQLASNFCLWLGAKKA